MRGRNVLVMIDGVSQNSSRGLSRQFDSISPFNVERVEVLSGASAIYGGGATGGIINIVTKKGEPGPARFETQLGASSGFNNSDDLATRFAQSISGGNERFNARLGISGEQNEAFYDAPATRFSSTTPRPTCSTTAPSTCSALWLAVE